MKSNFLSNIKLQIISILAKHRNKVKPIYIACYPYLYKLNFYKLLWQRRFAGSWQQANRLHYVPEQHFSYLPDKSDGQSKQQLSRHLAKSYNRIAFYGTTRLNSYLLDNNPILHGIVACVISDAAQEKIFHGVPVVTPSELPEGIDAIFVDEHDDISIDSVKERLTGVYEYLSVRILAEINRWLIPKRAFAIFPAEIKYPRLERDLEFVLIDLPCRYSPIMMPNGLAYVHNLLKTSDIKFQTIDYNIIMYHMFHSNRLLGVNKRLGDRELPGDLWDAAHENEWRRPEILDFFKPQIEAIVCDVLRVKPRILGISLNTLNYVIAREIIIRVKKYFPEMIVISGGYLSANEYLGADIIKNLVPEIDYVFVGEADLTLLPLLKDLLSGKESPSRPGILAKNNPAIELWQPAPLIDNLDTAEMPKYDWINPKVYKTHYGAAIVPIISSRGCRWSKCSFCGECFPWRKRSPANVVDEIEWFADRGFVFFHFNESDFNGEPESVTNIAKEIIRRKLKVHLLGQLRIHKKSTASYFATLSQAGFKEMRFGVDAWAKNTLKGQMKGYTKDMVRQNLRDCHNAGIVVKTNMIVGVPGETDADAEESIDFVLENKNYIDAMENINPLLLIPGSFYYENPEKYNIKFRGDKNKIYAENTRVIPHHLWYSVDPYIDHEIRQARLEKLCNALLDGGVSIGNFARTDTKKKIMQLEASKNKA